MLDTLAAAYAGAGRYPDAVRTAERLLELAMSSGRPDLIAAARKKLDMLKKGAPSPKGR
jgi:hypothetical protein